MTTQVRRISFWTLLVVAFKQFRLKRQIRYFEVAYAGEKNAAEQAEHNAQWYKLMIGKLRYKLEDLQNATE